MREKDNSTHRMIEVFRKLNRGDTAFFSPEVKTRMVLKIDIVPLLSKSKRVWLTYAQYFSSSSSSSPLSLDSLPMDANACFPASSRRAHHLPDGTVKKPSVRKHIYRCRHLLNLYVQRARLGEMWRICRDENLRDEIDKVQRFVMNEIDTTYKVSGYDSYFSCIDYRKACDMYTDKRNPNYIARLPADVFEQLLPFIAQAGPVRQVIDGVHLCL
jgi:hypothetical protein